MTTIGLRLGGPVLLIERRGEREIVHDALVMAMSMDPDAAGTQGEMMIDAVWVTDNPANRRRMTQSEWQHALFFFPDVVHISHRDWLERRVAVAYEELSSKLASQIVSKAES